MAWGRGNQEFGAKVFGSPEFLFFESHGFCFWKISVFRKFEGFGGSEKHTLSLLLVVSIVRKLPICTNLLVLEEDFSFLSESRYFLTFLEIFTLDYLKGVRYTKNM